MAFSPRKHRKALLISVTAIGAIVATAGLYLWATDMDFLKMGDFGPPKQREWAEKLVVGLNTHDPEEVRINRPDRMSDEQKQTIEAAMPASGCYYELVSVRDRGEQARRPAPGLHGDIGTYRFDMTVDEHCSEMTRTRVIGVMAIADMGTWAPYYFVE